MRRDALSTLTIRLILALALAGLSGTAASAQAVPPPAASDRMGIPALEFQARRQTLRAELKKAAGERPAVAILRGIDTRDREDFEEGRFRQDNWFAYLTGIEIPGAFLMLTTGFADQPDRDVLYLPTGSLGSAFSGGVQKLPPAGEESAKMLAFGEVAPTSRLLGDLFTTLADPMRPGGGSGRPALYTIKPTPRAADASAEAKFVRFLKEGAPTTDFRDLAPLVAQQRKVKSKAELAILQRTIDITGNAQRAVMAAVKPGLFEYQLEGRLQGAFLDGGALRPGFASIVGSGPNACIPHYFANNRQMEAGDLVVVDIGAEVANYTADITRTFPVSGTFSPRQRELYQLVLDAQQHAADQMKPGKVRLYEMTGVVRKFLRESPLRAKDERGVEHTMDHFFIHGLGHYLGLDVHDVGNGGLPMAEGEVFTIEPGLYIPSEAIGIRIEDDYLMGPDGPIKLSAAIPSKPEEIEALIAEARRRAGEPVPMPAAGTVDR